MCPLEVRYIKQPLTPSTLSQYIIKFILLPEIFRHLVQGSRDDFEGIRYSLSSRSLPRVHYLAQRGTCKATSTFGHTLSIYTQTI
jgi:hypothetical protein